MEKSKIDRIIESVRSHLREEPVNNVGGGQIAGTVELEMIPSEKEKETHLPKRVKKDLETRKWQIKLVAVLEERLENFEMFVLLTLLLKIAEVNNNVAHVGGHEERITKQEEIDSVLFDKIDKLRDKMEDYKVTKRLSSLERKLWLV